MASAPEAIVAALRTGDVSSYSLTYLLLANLGNGLYSAYVYSLPMGPIWALHTFYLVTSAVLLLMYLRLGR